LRIIGKLLPGEVYAVDKQGETLDQAAGQWMDQHQGDWRGWIKTAQN